MGLAACLILFAITITSVLSEPKPADRAVDCRKFVFAPLCRGVAAKRSMRVMRDGIVVEANKLREFLKNYNMIDTIPREENLPVREAARTLHDSRRRESDTMPFYDYDHN